MANERQNDPVADTEHDARIRADERAKVLAAVLEAHRQYMVNDYSDPFRVWLMLPGILESIDGNTALRDLLAREREAGARDERQCDRCGAEGRPLLCLPCETSTLDAARAHGAREALESAADAMHPTWNVTSAWLRARANAIDPTTYADTLRAEARRDALIEASKVASAYATEKSRYAVAESAGLEIAERLRVLAQAPAAAQPFVSSVRGQGMWAATAQSLADEARIRADERARVMAAVADVFANSFQDGLRDGDEVAGLILGGGIPDGDTALRDLLAREREAGRAEVREQLQTERELSTVIAANARAWQDHAEKWKAERDAARAPGAKEALVSAAEHLRKRQTELSCSGAVAVLIARAAAIDPTTYADTLRAEAAASELERFAEEYSPRGMEILEMSTAADVAKLARARAAELRAKGSKNDP